MKANGKTAIQDAFATDYRGEICPFGEVVMAKRNVSDSGAIQGGGRLMKADSAWDKAVWLGRSDGTDEHLVGDETGVYKTRSVRRLLDEGRALGLGGERRCEAEGFADEDRHGASCLRACRTRHPRHTTRRSTRNTERRQRR